MVEAEEEKASLVRKCQKAEEEIETGGEEVGTPVEVEVLKTG